MGKLSTRQMVVSVALTFLASHVFAQSAGIDDLKVFDYSAEPEVVILSYSETSQLLANADPTPRIQVYGDGYVWIHYPEYMKKAGDYGLHLNRGEITALLKRVSGSFGFNAQNVRNSRNNIKRAREVQSGEAVYRSDGTLEEIKVDLLSYQETPDAPGIAISEAMIWRDIAIDAREYPEIQELQNLNRARAAIRALLEHRDLVKVDGPPAGQ